MRLKRLLLVAVWTPATVMGLLLSVLLLHSYSRTKQINQLLTLQARQMLPKNGYQFYAALPQVLGSFSQAIAKEDARSEILKQFLAAHESPLESYAATLVSASEEKGIDFRLITAIGMCESNVGKKMPVGSHNAWGYAIYTGEESGATFGNWEDAIRTMADYLAEKYYTQGLTTPEEIGPIYAPPSVETGNSWAKCVRTFMDELS